MNKNVDVHGICHLESKVWYICDDIFIFGGVPHSVFGQILLKNCLKLLLFFFTWEPSIHIKMLKKLQNSTDPKNTVKNKACIKELAHLVKKCPMYE